MKKCYSPSACHGSGRRANAVRIEFHWANGKCRNGRWSFIGLFFISEEGRQGKSATNNKDGFSGWIFRMDGPASTQWPSRKHFPQPCISPVSFSQKRHGLLLKIHHRSRDSTCSGNRCQSPDHYKSVSPFICSCVRMAFCHR